jgi:V/A-type H+-transporting ATPase subunit I
MAIERMKSVWFFDPRRRSRELVDRLGVMGLSHVTDEGMPPPEALAELGLARAEPEAQEIERRVQCLRDILEVLTPFAGTSKGLLQNFIPTPIELQAEELQRALGAFDAEALHAETREADRRRLTAAAALQRAAERLATLEPLRGLAFTIPGRTGLRRTAMFAGTLPTGQYARLAAGGALPRTAVLSETGRLGRRSVAQAACAAEEREALAGALRDAGFEMIEPEAQALPISEYLDRKAAEAEELRLAVAAEETRLRALAQERRAEVEAALGYWEERLKVARAAAMAAQSRRLTVLKAYVRETDLPEFERRMARELPEVVLLVRDPKPGEAVPVSLKNHKLLAPGSFLVEMFGLPEYFTFDPTPVIFFSFLIFFGFCFGDVLYGVLLIVMGWMLARKYRDYPTLRNFFLLLAYAGIPTIIVGALTGAWAGDLPLYLGKDNFLQRWSDALIVANPIDKALEVLLIALALGVLNQFLGIIMLMVRNIRQGDVKSAVYDGGFWLILLPGTIVLMAAMFVKVPGGLMAAAGALCAVGAVGLVLTQGRAEKSLTGKIAVGVVSLYGIVGSYGITAFIGDTLSYSRLLALGLTTGIVAMCFNMIASMTKDWPWGTGIVVFTVLVVAGHLLNFFLSVLGGFVHSARLTFVEFFGRFYQGGAPRFQPLGVWRGRIRVTDRATIWTDGKATE